MKHFTQHTFFAFLLAITTLPAGAQHTRSAYFTDGYLYRHEMNPAVGNEKSYISLPALGNINVALRGNLAFDNIIHNVNGHTTTFMNPAVDTRSFLKDIHDNNRLVSDIKVEILSAGFKAFGGYNTIGLNLRANIGANIPGSLFRLAKQGPENRSYDIRDLKAHADAYAELSLGHSRQWNKKLRVGGALKVLLGGANMDADFQRARLTLGENAWTAVTNARLQSSIKGLTYKTKEKMRGAEGEKTLHRYVSGMDVDGTGLNGFGLALDLGAEYKLNDTWTFSASLLDLGFIHWNNNMVASTDGDRPFTTDKYIFNADDHAHNSFSNEMDRLGESFATLYELNDKGDQGGRSKMLGATMNLGAEYTLPAWKKLSFGLLSTTRFQKDFGWTEFRLSANVAPVKILSGGINMAIGTFGCSFGWIANFHPKRYNLYVGMDHTLGKLAKQGIPLSGNGSVNVGMNIPF